MAEKKRQAIQLPSRISFNEFVTLNTEMTSVAKAGFKAFCRGKDWMRQAEWEKALKDYEGVEEPKEEPEVEEEPKADK